MRPKREEIEKQKEEIRLRIDKGQEAWEIKELMSSKYNICERTISRRIKEVQTGIRQTISSTPKINRTKISDNCYFCGNDDVVTHHISYVPEVIINLCESCHSKLHYVVDEYHKQIKEKDFILAEVFGSVILVGFIIHPAIDADLNDANPNWSILELAFCAVDGEPLIRAGVLI